MKQFLNEGIVTKWHYEIAWLERSLPALQNTCTANGAVNAVSSGERRKKKKERRFESEEEKLVLFSVIHLTIQTCTIMQFSAELSFFIASNNRRYFHPVLYPRYVTLR